MTTELQKVISAVLLHSHMQSKVQGTAKLLNSLFSLCLMSFTHYDVACHKKFYLNKIIVIH